MPRLWDLENTTISKGISTIEGKIVTGFVHSSLRIESLNLKGPEPTVIKLFESEIVLKCKIHLHEFIETSAVFIFKLFGKSFAVIIYRYY